MGEVTWLGPVELDLETLRSFITVSEEESLARAAPRPLGCRAVSTNWNASSVSSCWSDPRTGSS
jgi:hypothetical protein